jgi:hypothetical protein
MAQFHDNGVNQDLHTISDPGGPEERLPRTRASWATPSTSF